jgi:hypothetical protein
METPHPSRFARHLLPQVEKGIERVAAYAPSSRALNRSIESNPAISR